MKRKRLSRFRPTNFRRFVGIISIKCNFTRSEYQSQCWCGLICPFVHCQFRAVRQSLVRIYAVQKWLTSWSQVWPKFMLSASAGKTAGEKRLRISRFFGGRCVKSAWIVCVLHRGPKVCREMHSMQQTIRQSLCDTQFHHQLLIQFDAVLCAHLCSASSQQRNGAEARFKCACKMLCIGVDFVWDMARMFVHKFSANQSISVQFDKVLNTHFR